MATVQTSKSKDSSTQRAAQSSKKNAGAQTSSEERDENYDLISVLYHALKGADTCAQYCRDAQEEGDDQLAEFMEAARSTQVGLAQQAKSLLAARLDEDEIAGEGEEDEELDDEEA